MGKFKKFPLRVLTSKITKRLKDIKIGLKLNLSFAIIMVMSLLIVGVASFKIISDSLIQQTRLSTQQLIVQTSKNLNVTYGEIDRLALTMARNQQLGEYVYSYQNANESDKVILNYKIREVLREYISSNSYLTDSFIISSANKDVFTNSSYGILNSYDIYKSSAYQKFKELNEKNNLQSLWIDTYISDNDNIKASSEKIITLFKVMRLDRLNIDIGNVMINIKQVQLQNLIANIKLNYNGKLIVIGNTGNTVMNPLNTNLNGHIINDPYIKRILKTVYEDKILSGDFFDKIGGENYLITFSHVEKTNWIVVGTTKYNNITSVRNKTGVLIFIIGFICLIFGVIVYTLITMDMTSAIYLLIKNMEEVRNGNLSLNLRLNRKDELGDLCNSFMYMVQNIKLLIESIEMGSLKTLDLNQTEVFAPKVHSIVKQDELTSKMLDAQKKIHEILYFDILTGAYNRRFFSEYYELEITRAKNQLLYGKKEHEFIFAIAVIDIDNFKKVNDTYGHLAGDNVLKELVKKIKEVIFTKDIICRYGGEEFIIVFTNTQWEGALQAVEKIRETIQRSSFYFNESVPDGHITVSIGFAAFGKDDSDDLFKLADNRLYIAKRTGKNKVVYN